MRRDLLLLEEMIEAAERARALVAGADLATVTADLQRRDALLWNFTVLGEAAAQLDDRVTGSFREVPWTQPIRLRNRIVHGYWSIDMEILHTTATDLLPGFVEQLRRVVEALESDEGGT
jgi:uncharacterized protein with HEPN domain